MDVGLTDVLDEGPPVKTDQYTFGIPSALLLPSSPEKLPEDDRREPSPFGFPALLAMQKQQDAADPPATNDAPILPDYSHNGLYNQIPQSIQQNGDTCPVEHALLAAGDWDMGDDELELIEEECNKVKAEDDDAVDIDLTLDDDPSSAEEKPVESCPICERELVGMSNLVRSVTRYPAFLALILLQEIHDHVDACLNALPGSTTPGLKSTSASSGSKPLRPLSALQVPQMPKSEPIAGSSKFSVKQEGEGDIFATLMTSYKENEAWKEASAVEDRDFRPTKANGGRRKAPFYKVMQGMPIAVDAFRYGAIPNVTAYFLTYALYMRSLRIS